MKHRELRGWCQRPHIHTATAVALPSLRNDAPAETSVPVLHKTFGEVAKHEGRRSRWCRELLFLCLGGVTAAGRKARGLLKKGKRARTSRNHLPLVWGDIWHVYMVAHVLHMYVCYIRSLLVCNIQVFRKKNRTC